MHAQATVVQPAAQPALFTFRLHPAPLDTAHKAASGAGQAALPALEQHHDHSKAGRQMTAVYPGHRLTQPSVQAIVEGGVFSQHLRF
jgi:hypothetical protein